MTILVLTPNVEIITMTRDMALSRQEEIDYLKKHGFSADFTKLKYSYNVGLWMVLLLVYQWYPLPIHFRHLRRKNVVPHSPKKG